MAPTTIRIAQTSSEAKKNHKQYGLGLPARQQKQLERAHELDARAVRLREAENRRKAAKKKRDIKEEKEKTMRKQMGIGLATQLIGYSHTQAQLKTGMEAFLGVKGRKEEEHKDMDLSKKLELIDRQVEKEPWDDDDADDIVLDPPLANTSFGKSYLSDNLDDDLDDDTMLEAHDLAISDPTEKLPRPSPYPSATTPSKDNPSFTHLHGPINKAAETILDQLPAPLLELLSQDISMKLPEWDPAPSLLHRLNPLALPPHRLRIKVGSIVTLLRDFNASSHLSNCQHLRILRADSRRLECFGLDGQLEGTKVILTRTTFEGNYKNNHLYPFQRLQFPIRVSTGYTPPNGLQNTSSSSRYTLPSMCSDQARPTSIPKTRGLFMRKHKSQANRESDCKLHELSVSKSVAPRPTRLLLTSQAEVAAIPPTMDSWADFFDSGTQIARELCSEVFVHSAKPLPITVAPESIASHLPLLSTQDFDFSIDDLEEAVLLGSVRSETVRKNTTVISTKPLHPTAAPIRNHLPFTGMYDPLVPPIPSSRRPGAGELTDFRTKLNLKPQPCNGAGAPPNFAASPQFQKPPSVSDRPGLKRKVFTSRLKNPVLSTKGPCAQPTSLGVAPRPGDFSAFDDFSISSQEVAFYFVEDDELILGSPPAAV